MKNKERCVICKKEFFVCKSQWGNIHKITCSRGCATIYRKTLKPNILKDNTDQNEIIVPNNILEIINGELLGDGSIAKQAINANFLYGTSNREYAIYLRNMLSIFGAGEIKEYSGREIEGYACNTAYYFQTRVSPSLTSIYDRWYLNKVKIVPKDLNLSPLTCLHWYIGDGYVSRDRIGFCTNGFQKEEVEFLSNSLYELGFRNSMVKKSPNKDGNPTFEIGMSVYNTKEFLDYIGECPVSSYLYKWDISEECESYYEYPYTTTDISNLLSISQTSARKITEREWFKPLGVKTKRIYGNLRFHRDSLDIIQMAYPI